MYQISQNLLFYSAKRFIFIPTQADFQHPPPATQLNVEVPDRTFYSLHSVLDSCQMSQFIVKDDRTILKHGPHYVNVHKSL